MTPPIPGWDPYGNGYWMFTPGYGYIWASGYSWGYMPYQCGLWNWYDGFGWGWAPGINPCRGWWYGGFYGGPYIGIRYGGYHPPNRPRKPFGSGSQPARGAPAGGCRPSVAQRRVSLPSRDHTAVVTIAGHTVQPQHPISPRPQYSRAEGGVVGHPGYQGASATHGAVPGYTNGSGKPVAPASAKGGSGHAASGSHPASSGGGGGHISAGGGGGGGGGGHPSGGGGGAHH